MTERRHVHLDAVGGVAGDMFVAAMLDAAPSLRQRVFADLAAVMPDHCGRPELLEGTSSGLSVLRFGLAGGPAAVGTSDHHQDHDHDHDHHHHRDHYNEQETVPSDSSFPALAQRISAAPLGDGSADEAIAILRVLAEAESRVHRQPLDEVRFHEIADWDSLMDVVAAGSIIAGLANATWSVSDLPRGSGLVRTRHGLLPIPAPATAEILKGFTWRDDGIAGERVTPTGAAILAHLVGTRAGSMGLARLSSVGTGAGKRALAGLPNILRALMFDAETSAEAVHVLSFDIDDMTGEEIGLALERLRAAPGLIDVTVGSRMGKKGRPVNDFRLLVRPEAVELGAEAVFSRDFHHRLALAPRTTSLSRAGRRSPSGRRSSSAGQGGASPRQSGDTKSRERRPGAASRLGGTPSPQGFGRKGRRTDVSKPDNQANLVSVLDRHAALAIAVSGGVDSMMLAFVAGRYSQAAVTVVHAVSPAVPAAATRRVEAYAARHNWTLRSIDAGELADPDYRANPSDRCYYCKSNLYSAIRSVVEGTIASGTNVDDLQDFRPGLNAARLHGVIHPFVEAGMRKADIYALARNQAIREFLG